jgi:hypothetical protein
VAEPDPDRGHIDGAAPDEIAFVIPGGDGAVLAELAEGPLDRVALLIGSGVEGRRAASRDELARLLAEQAACGVSARSYAKGS